MSRIAAYGRCQVDSRRARNQAERSTPFPPLVLGGRISKDSPKRGSVILLRLGWVAFGRRLVVTVGVSSPAAMVCTLPSPRAISPGYPKSWTVLSVCHGRTTLTGIDRPTLVRVTKLCRDRYLISLDSLRSASGLPPVWQPGQYWKLESWNETSRIVSPHTGQGNPVRACTASPERFSPLRVAAC